MSDFTTVAAKPKAPIATISREDVYATRIVAAAAHLQQVAQRKRLTHESYMAALGRVHRLIHDYERDTLVGGDICRDTRAVVEAVSQVTGIDVDEITGPCRKRHLVVARMLVAGISTGTQEAIGIELGGREHTSIFYLKMRYKTYMQQGDKHLLKLDTLARQQLKFNKNL